MPDAPDDPALAIEDLRKSYAGVPVLDGLALDVGKGECFGLLGPSGAGKTTTLEICAGLGAADSGQVRLFGESWDASPRELRPRVGLQMQGMQLGPRQTVRETLDLFRGLYRRGFEVGTLIAMSQLEARSEVRVEALSEGQKRRLAIACALAGDPDLLFLDDPSDGLDPSSQQLIWALALAVRQSGCTIVLSTHDPKEAETLCDRVALIDKGRIVACGPPRDLMQQLDSHFVVEAEIEPGTLDEAALLALPVVRRVRREGARIDIETLDLHTSLPAILVAFLRQSLRLRSLRTRAATLADVFAMLTGRGLADG